MRLPEIKRLAETYNSAQLQASEVAILEGQTLPEGVSIEGEEDGERLTHISAALYVLDEVSKGVELKVALRNFSARVRESIS